MPRFKSKKAFLLRKGKAFLLFWPEEEMSRIAEIAGPGVLN
jgi:hypothetical protein